MAAPGESGQAVIDRLDAGAPGELLLAHRRDGAAACLDVAHGVLDLISCLRDFDPGSPERLARTGLVEDVRPAPDVEIDPARRARELIDALREDPELGPLARLARQVGAAAHIPRPPLTREAVASGGTGDISNRGPLDRLLLSELAHDEETLAVRLALGEALFTRPEAPPAHTPVSRAILVDAGIRSWGVARVFSTAVALALVEGAEAGAAIDVFTTGLEGPEPTDLTTRVGVVRHLGVLSASPHPAADLGVLASVAAGEAAADRVLVTTESAYADRALQSALRELAGPGTYVFTVDDLGHVVLREVTSRGAKVLREARLDLASLVTEPRTIRDEPRSNAATRGLPAFYRATPCPLRVAPRPQASWHPYVEGQALCVSGAGEVYLWEGTDSGMRWLNPADRLASFRALATVEHEVFVLTGRRRSLRLTRLDPRTHETTHTPLELRNDDDPVAIIARQGLVAVVGLRRVWLFEPESGRLRADLACPERTAWSFGRFFRRWGPPDPAAPSGWFALAFRGDSVVFEPVPLPENAAGATDLFDRPGHDGPFALVPPDRAVRLTDGKEWSGGRGLRLAGRLTAVSPDGSRLALRAPQQHLHFYGDQLARDWRLMPPHRVEVRARVRGVQELSDGGLRVVGRRSAYDLAIRAGELRWSQAPIGPVAVQPLERPSRSMSGPKWLRVATLRSGACARFDTRRGLLHVIPAEPGVPEVSLLLTVSGASPAWISDGRTHGPRNLIVGDETASAEETYAALRRAMGAGDDG